MRHSRYAMIVSAVFAVDAIGILRSLRNASLSAFPVSLFAIPISSPYCFAPKGNLFAPGCQLTPWQGVPAQLIGVNGSS